MRLRVGIDVGGTFTDVTAFDEDAGALVAVRKYVSNPAQPAAVMEQITRDLATDFGADSVALILHGSTAALNTMLEGKGVKVGLITTSGFRDVYEIGRQWRGDEVFNIFAPAPKMLLTRDRIHEVRERLDPRGHVIEKIDEEDVAAAIRRLVAQGVEAVAVCFLFAYANPAHEQAAAKIIHEIAPNLFVSLSHEVNPEWREYERTASSVANAYIGPPVSRYLHELEALSLRRFPGARALMMKSDGGAASARMLDRTPIETVMSGPVAGGLASAVVWAVGAQRGSSMLEVLANLGFLLNAFNLLPIGFLDGGSIARSIGEAWRMPVIRFEGAVPMQALAPDRARAVTIASLYVALAGALVLGLLATRPNGML